MKVTNVEKKENSTVELTIHVEADEFEAAVQKAYLKSRSRIAVPGASGRARPPARSSRGCTAPACFMKMPSTTSIPAPMRPL